MVEVPKRPRGDRAEGSPGSDPASPETYLGDPLPPAEQVMWASLTKVQRTKALRRMGALRRWVGPEGLVDAKRAAIDAGVSVTRVYEMAKAWRARPSLSSLGTFAAAPKTRLGRHDAAIMKAIGGIVDADPEGSVRKLALDLAAAVRGELDPVPGRNTLRRYLDRELRRREREGTAGNDVMLDCTACLLTPSDARVLNLFVVIDRATQLVLGAALGNVADSRGGYAGAARDALRRFDDGRFDRLRWTDRVERSEIVAGADVERWSAVVGSLKDAGVVRNVTVATAPDRFGRYLRPATRLRIGTVALMPKHTLAPRGGLAVPTADDESRLAVEVDEYDALIVPQLGGADGGPPPRDLRRLLGILSDG